MRGSLFPTTHDIPKMANLESDKTGSERPRISSEPEVEQKLMEVQDEDIEEGEISLSSEEDENIEKLSEISDVELEANQSSSQSFDLVKPSSAAIKKKRNRNCLNQEDIEDEGASVLVPNPLYKPGMYHKRSNRNRGLNSRESSLETKEKSETPKQSEQEESDDDEEEDEENLDDIGEDLLCLRLIALRSMAPELELNGEKSEEEQQPEKGEEKKSDKLEAEMEELIEEADEAASNNKDIIPVIDVLDSDEEREAKKTGKPDMSYLVRKLRNSLAKQKRQEEEDAGADVQGDGQYSPTQSPIRVSDGMISSMDICHLGPSSSSVAGEGEEMIPLPPSSPSTAIAREVPAPPSPPSISTTPIPPPPPRLSLEDEVNQTKKQKKNVSMAVFLAKLPNAEPLPPGDEESFNLPPPQKKRSNNKRHLSTTEPVDMELGSENEAEIQFFRKQEQELVFPTSVWEFNSNRKKNPNNSNIKMKDVLTFSNEEERYDAFLQAVVTSNYKECIDEVDTGNIKAVVPRFNNKQNNKNRARINKNRANRRKRKRKASKDLHQLTQQPQPNKVQKTQEVEEEGKEEEEGEDLDEEAMRAMLLTSMMKKKQEQNKSVHLEKENTDHKISMPLKKSPPTTTVKSATAVPKKTAKGAPEKRNGILTEIHKNPKAIRDFEKSLHLENLRNNNDVRKLENSARLQHKHFPNLVKQFLIPLNHDEDSEDVDDEDEEEKDNVPKVDEKFSMNLDQLLKSSRNQTETLVIKKKKIPPPKPIRKNLPLPVPLVKKVVPAKVKADLLKDTSGLKHLPPAKQQEYKLLKAKLAKLQKAKTLLASSKKKSILVKPPLNKTAAMKTVGNTEKEEEDDAEKLRQELLTKNKEDPSDKIVKEILEQASPNTMIVKPKSSLTVSLSGESRNVQVQNKNKQNEMKPVVQVQQPHGQKQRPMSLRIKEEAVISKRKELVGNLFKLSAQISSLKDNNAKRASAEEFVNDLKQQLKEAEQILAKKKERIVNLKSVVVNSHKQITTQRNDIRAQEKECQELGQTFLGQTYRLPTDCSKTIQQKLASIANNTRELNKQNPVRKDEKSMEQTEEKDLTMSDKNPQPDTKPKSDSSDSLAHFRVGLGLSSNFDPHTELCRFELMGKCNDDKCTYQHMEQNKR